MKIRFVVALVGLAVTFAPPTFAPDPPASTGIQIADRWA
jgi:hypothetical protein